MAQSYVQLPDDAANLGKREDHWVTSLQGYYREGVVIADPSTDAAVAPVVNADPSTSAYGLVVRLPNTNPLDYDSGAGSVPQLLVGIAIPASGGPVGVSRTNPLPVIQVETGDNPATAAVTDTSSTAVALNASRRRATITNWGANDVSLAYGAVAVFGRGEYLLAGGGSTQIFSTQAVTAICNTGKTSNLAIQEWE